MRCGVRVGAVLDETAFASAAAALCAADPDLAAIVERHGLPEFWARDPGFATLVLLILEQQVSLASARAAYDRLETRLGGLDDRGILASSDAELRADGFSRQKARYVRALATAIEDGSLDLAAWRRSTTTRRGTRSWRCPGSGRGRPRSTSSPRCAGPTPGRSETSRCRRARDVRAASRCGPSPAELEAIGEAWRPHRATAARLLWHLYLSERR